MAKFRVGSVPYVNAHPLVWGLQSQGVEVVYDVPSRLPALLDAEEVDAVLVSSIESLRRPELETLANVAIISKNAVESVRIFSKVPWEEIKSLALDQSSMTSNALALSLLNRRNYSQLDCKPLPPDLEAMLENHDAGLLIGDKGMDQESGNLFTYDLGELWKNHTSLPFVWALWTAKRGQDWTELSAILDQAYAQSKFEWEFMLQDSTERSGWTLEKTRRYLEQTMSFTLDEEARKGLNTYSIQLQKFGQIQPGTQRATGTV